jgi:hypothetical protein
VAELRNQELKYKKKMQTSLSTNPARDQANSNGDEDEEQKQEQNGAYRD